MLETGQGTKTDDFLEKFQMANGPSSHSYFIKNESISPTFFYNHDKYITKTVFLILFNLL